MSANGKTPFLTPQQELFLSYYTDPKSPTFSNALQSALKAGYTQEYGESITAKGLDWLSDNVGDLKMLQKAERNLNKALDIDIENEKIGDRALKATLFVAEKLGKNKYSSRTEITGENGNPIEIKEINDTLSKKLDSLIESQKSEI